MCFESWGSARSSVPRACAVPISCGTCGPCQRPAVITLHPIVDGQAEALEFQVGPETRHRGEALKDVPLKKGILIASINHRGHTTIPKGDSSFSAGDTIIVVAAGDEAISDLDDIFAD